MLPNSPNENKLVFILQIPAKTSSTTITELIKTETQWELVRDFKACPRGYHAFRRLVLNVNNLGTFFVSIHRRPGIIVDVKVPFHLNLDEKQFTLRGVCLYFPATNKTTNDRGHYTYMTILNKERGKLYNDANEPRSIKLDVDDEGFIKIQQKILINVFSRNAYVCMYNSSNNEKLHAG